VLDICIDKIHIATNRVFSEEQLIKPDITVGDTRYLEYGLNYMPLAQFHNTLIRLRFSPIYHAKVYIFQTIYQELLLFKAEYIVYL